MRGEAVGHVSDDLAQTIDGTFLKLTDWISEDIQILDMFCVRQWKKKATKFQT